MKTPFKKLNIRKSLDKYLQEKIDSNLSVVQKEAFKKASEFCTNIKNPILVQSTLRPYYISKEGDNNTLLKITRNEVIFANNSGSNIIELPENKTDYLKSIINNRLIKEETLVNNFINEKSINYIKNI